MTGRYLPGIWIEGGRSFFSQKKRLTLFIGGRGYIHIINLRWISIIIYLWFLWNNCSIWVLFRPYLKTVSDSMTPQKFPNNLDFSSYSLIFNLLGGDIVILFWKFPILNSYLVKTYSGDTDMTSVICITRFLIKGRWKF